MTTVSIRKLGLLAVLILLPRLALAQGFGAASVAGVVRDPSGAVLPGVTVEASSPVLIEKVRTTVSDDEGRYQLAELRAGTYTLTFTLTGFTTYRRERLQLTPNFAATINAELEPFSMFGDRVRQVNLRVSKLFRMGTQRFQANVDVYNLANASTATFIRNTYTAPNAVTTTPWLQPTQVMDGRFVKFSAQVDL